MKEGIGTGGVEGPPPQAKQPRFFGTLLMALEKEGKRSSTVIWSSLPGRGRFGKRRSCGAQGKDSGDAPWRRIEPPMLREMCDSLKRGRRRCSITWGPCPARG